MLYAYLHVHEVEPGLLDGHRGCQGVENKSGVT